MLHLPQPELELGSVIAALVAFFIIITSVASTKVCPGNRILTFWYTCAIRLLSIVSQRKILKYHICIYIYYNLVNMVNIVKIPHRCRKSSEVVASPPSSL